jgi:drug/metabolite transporter (DMT)-like permease
MEDVKTIINSLGPGSGQQLFFDIILYWMFLINLGIMFLDNSSFGTNISMVVLLCIFIDKTFAFGYMFNPKNGLYDNDPEICHAKVFVGTYLIRVVMFAGPFAVAGSTRSGKVRTAAILAGLSAVIYMAARWFLEQREFNTSRVTCFNTDTVIQSAGMLLVLAKMTLRDRLCLGTIYRHIPVTVTRDFSAHDVEV